MSGTADIALLQDGTFLIRRSGFEVHIGHRSHGDIPGWWIEVTTFDPIVQQIDGKRVIVKGRDRVRRTALTVFDDIDAALAYAALYAGITGSANEKASAPGTVVPIAFARNSFCVTIGKDVHIRRPGKVPFLDILAKYGIGLVSAARFEIGFNPQFDAEIRQALYAKACTRLPSWSFSQGPAEVGAGRHAVIDVQFSGLFGPGNPSAGVENGEALEFLMKKHRDFLADKVFDQNDIELTLFGAEHVSAGSGNVVSLSALG